SNPSPVINFRQPAQYAVRKNKNRKTHFCAYYHRNHFKKGDQINWEDEHTNLIKCYMFEKSYFGLGKGKPKNIKQRHARDFLRGISSCNCDHPKAHAMVDKIAGAMSRIGDELRSENRLIQAYDSNGNIRPGHETLRSDEGRFILNFAQTCASATVNDTNMDNLVRILKTFFGARLHAALERYIETPALTTQYNNAKAAFNENTATAAQKLEMTRLEAAFNVQTANRNALLDRHTDYYADTIMIENEEIPDELEDPADSGDEDFYLNLSKR
ncbi:hypothetical protein BJ508DRAFT_336894, partial [Ascobolus immersus RN42]